MRRFHSFRGSRRRSGLPRSTIRSAKYIVVSGPSSETSGIQAVTMATGTDNATLGQTFVTDATVPVGAKIASFEIFMPKVTLPAGSASFTVWTIQRTQSGQNIINPLVAGGSPLRKNILRTGVIGLGGSQNSQLHINYKVPQKYQRIGDGDAWQLVMDNSGTVQVKYYIIYKIFM